MIYRDNWTTEEMKQLRDYCVSKADKKDDEQLLWEALADMCELSRRLFEQREFRLWSEAHHGTTEYI